jgi:RNA polymerase-interacting CarD/CdnL/TRCF family regulator
METQTPSENSAQGVSENCSKNDSKLVNKKGALFTPGTPVIYAMHGRCKVIGTESRSVDQDTLLFYKLELKKLGFSRSGRQEPAIWVPVATAKEKGLRLPMSRSEADTAMKVLSSREYYFKLNQPWPVVQTQLETTIRLEGGIGLAKVASYLFVLRRKQIVPTAEVAKLQEAVHRLLFRELSDSLEEPSRTLEEKVSKGFRSKLLPDL